MRHYEQIASQNDLYKIDYNDVEKTYIGTVFHPETGREVIQLIADSERGLRAELTKWLFSNEFNKL
jgi:hypothetical protein